MLRRSASYALIVVGIGAASARAQPPRPVLEALPPSPRTKVITLSYINPFDRSTNEALLELPHQVNGRIPLIVTPHAANWTQEMNRSLWTGVADRFGVMILYPRHQGKLNPRVTFGSPKQMCNLEAAVAETKRRYPVDSGRLYIAGLSQGAVESLLYAGRNATTVGGVLAMNPVVDCLAFYEDLAAFLSRHEQMPPDPVTKLRLAQWTALLNVMNADFGGTPDTARTEYYLRSATLYAPAIASVPLVLFWAENDELIPNGGSHQGGMFANLLRKLNGHLLRERRHANGHGYPFYRVDLAQMKTVVFPREIFLSAVKELLMFQRGAPPH